MMTDIKITEEEKRELWERVGFKQSTNPREKHLDVGIPEQHWLTPDGQVCQTYSWGRGRLPPTDLNNLGKYAWPVAVGKIRGQHLNAEETPEEYLFRKWLYWKKQGYSLQDALFKVCYEVICK